MSSLHPHSHFKSRLSAGARGVQARSLGLVMEGERVVVSQCPRTLPDGAFAEAAVVKFVVAGDEDDTAVNGATSAAGLQRRGLGKVGSCMDLGAAMTVVRATKRWSSSTKAAMAAHRELAASGNPDR